MDGLKCISVVLQIKKAYDSWKEKAGCFTSITDWCHIAGGMCDMGERGENEETEDDFV